MSANNSANNSYSFDDGSVDSNYDPEIPTFETTGSVDGLEDLASTIRAEFKTYQSVLPKPDELLQQKHSFANLKKRIEDAGLTPPQFLKYTFEGGIKPHVALCCLLLSEYQSQDSDERQKSLFLRLHSLLVYAISFGRWIPQINYPPDFIRYQFNRVAVAVPTHPNVKAEVLRKKIKDRGLPVPNYFLDPEDPKQFPPHIALLVVLQDGEKESRKLNSVLNRFVFSLFAWVALFLRIVLEVIGGAGAIWGGAEVFGLRTHENRELWRWISIAIGALCFLRFLTLNAPQREDEGDILGPTGPWSLRLSVRLRAVCDHPFHYFFRAAPPPPSPQQKKDK